MRALIQRVNHARVTALSEGAPAEDTGAWEQTGAIERGFLILLGVGQQDTEAQADKLWSKISKLRIFDDEAGKTNLALADVSGQVMVVSQFTLYADCRKGNRPSFTNAGAPAEATRLYEYFCDLVRRDLGSVATGTFGAHMRIDLENDGPFTVWLDTDAL
ncbi:MAG: D-tyrosyl-tRNA(Tyr) deacylase [Coriobacteriia bacterium]|nr:D-tyrosyl-tRNA(Tyr) deacylase [Coriobacteriia bacterium]MBS5478875.1 D-tyrosyl-tRNA(Tyr) deacylase [Coriobacteriia bacterium]